MQKELLIASIHRLVEFGGITYREIELTLGMGENSLSSIVKGTRSLPLKWMAPLAAYIEAKTAGQNFIIIPIVEKRMNKKNISSPKL